MDEAHVEHAVGFIEHQHLDLVEAQRVGAHQIKQAARRCDQHVEAIHELANLPAHRHAADDQRAGNTDVPAVGAEAVENLA